MSPESGWLLVNEIRPRLISAIPNNVPFVAPEDAQKVIASGVCMAAQLINGAENNGKKLVQSPTKPNGRYRKQAREITCGNVGYYVIQKLRNGRRSTGSSTTDAHAVGTQLHARARLSSMDEEVASDDLGEPLLLHDVLGNDQEDPSTRAARKMDWSDFLSGLSKRDVAVIECLIEGKPLAGLARRRHLNTSTMMYHKERLGRAIQAYMGTDILIEIGRKPRWKDSINATREKLACHDQRRSL
jgi:hypothetical protein